MLHETTKTAEAREDRRKQLKRDADAAFAKQDRAACIAAIEQLYQLIETEGDLSD